MSPAYMKSSEDRKTLDKSETKILKSKGSRTLGDSGEQRERVDEKKGKELYTKTCCVRFVRNGRISERMGKITDFS